jgi:cystathionine beta-lyase
VRHEEKEVIMKRDTQIVNLGRDPESHYGTVNPPVCHASTIVFPTVGELETRGKRPGKQLFYGILGTPTSFALEEAIAKLEGGYDTKVFPSGLAAIAVTLMTYLKTGDHLLMVDSVYGPTRRFCDNDLSRFGVEITYYDPLIGPRIAELFRVNTKVIYVESPGSNTFEIQDVPAISEAAKRKDIKVIMDNAWATPLYFKPFEHGVDISIQPVTKYISGHSDVMLGAVTTTETDWPALKSAARNFGQGAAPDDCYLALRGLRTMHVRLERHQKTGLTLAEWLQGRPEVDRVLHPGLPVAPGHELWKRDFLGASGLFGVILKPCPREALKAMLEDLELFGIGLSWGGFESLIVMTYPAELRTATKWTAAGPSLRIHVGLEAPDDLIADLEAGFKRLQSKS